MRNTFFLILFLFSSTVLAADLPISNAGFVPSNIWYSKDIFYSGDTVRVYTVVFNGSAYDLTGAVEFLDNGVSIGKTKFSISHGGRAQDLWVDWKTGEGKHTIIARLTDVVADGPNGKQSVVLPNAETGTNERNIELDPVAKEVQAKLEAQKVAVAHADAIGAVDNAVRVVSDAIPVPVKEVAATGANIIEQFRITEANQLMAIKNQKSKEIDAIAARSKIVAPAAGTTKKTTASVVPPGAIEKPLAYVMLAAVSALEFVFEWRVVFYGGIFYALYLLVKWVVYKIKNRA